jgi:glycerophosphoryl diester phosphodiesterase
MAGVLVIAHRGASAAFPENTVEAFRGAAALGADWVELDVHATADGALAVHHDAHLPGGGRLQNLTFAELPETVPTLAEALDACAGMGVNIEIKDGSADAVVALLDERGGRDEVLVSSFDPQTVARVRALAPHVPTALLVTEVPPDAVARVVEAGHAALHPYDTFVDAGLVAACHEAGVAVNVWTVDDPARMAELVGFGVDGLCTNVPDVARKLVDAA